MGLDQLKFTCKRSVTHLPNNEKYFDLNVEGIDGRLKNIAATTFHPENTNFFWSIINFIIDFFWGPRIIKVLAKNQLEPLYVKVDKIAQALGHTRGDFLKALCNCHGTAHELAMTFNILNGSGYTRTTDLPSLYALMKQVKLEYLLEILSRQNTGEFTKALLNVGTAIKEGKNSISGNVRRNQFSYCLDSGQIEFKFLSPNQITVHEITSIGKKTFKTKISNENDNRSKSIVVPEQSSRFSKFTSLFDSSSSSIPQGLQKLYLSKNIDTKGLDSVVKVINFENIIKLADGPFKNQKDKFLLTVKKIGLQMAENNTFLKILTGWTLSYTSESFNHFAFAVNGNTAIVVAKKFAEGSYKDASEAYVLNTCERIVELKIVERLKSGAVDLTLDEKDLLKKIAKNNPYLIPPYECVINKSSEKKLIMFQPYFDGDGSKLKNASAYQLTMIFRDVACGLSRMHQDQYVHSDFKPANMFFKGDLTGNEPLEGKVADIGMAQKMYGYFRGGSIAYLPPEVIAYSGYNIVLRPFTKVDDKLDSFSLGVSMFEILNGSLPWTPFGLLAAKDAKDYIDRLKNKYTGQNNFFPFERTLMLKMVDLTRGLLIQDKQQRFSCQKIANDLGAALSSL